MIIADYHVHSSFSSDSQAPMEQMIEEAIRLGLQKICFTDHMDFDYPPVSQLTFVFDPEPYFTKLEEMKERYQRQIKVLAGIELGLQSHLRNRMQSLIDRYPFDFVIGSSHIVDHMDPYLPTYWENRSIQDSIRRYFESIIEYCRLFQGFHVYGHLDYVVRYVPGYKEIKYNYNYSDYADILDVVLRTLLSYGKGIEINTAGLKYGLGYAHPKTEVLKRYRELGGELITIGSDGHKPEHLAYDFNVIPDYLKSLGYKYYATFEQGKPIYEKL